MTTQILKPVCLRGTSIDQATAAAHIAQLAVGVEASQRAAMGICHGYHATTRARMNPVVAVAFVFYHENRAARLASRAEMVARVAFGS